MTCGVTGQLTNPNPPHGALQDPNHVAEDVGVGGDNDPLDVCEIGLRQIPTGAVRQVKVLGVLCLIDDGEADWKVSERASSPSGNAKQSEGMGPPACVWRRHRRTPWLVTDHGVHHTTTTTTIDARILTLTLSRR